MLESFEVEYWKLELNTSENVDFSTAKTAQENIHFWAMKPSGKF